MNGQNSNRNFDKSGKERRTGETNINNTNNTANSRDNRDNISQQKKKKPSKAAKVIKTIFFVNFKILSYIINIILSILLVVIITGGILVGAFAFYIVNYIDPVMDDLVTMSSASELTTIIYYTEYEDRFTKSNPQIIEMEKLHGAQNRLWVKYSEITKNNMYLVNAFVALEDRRFFEHGGVDWYRTAAAARDFFIPTGGRVYGGSTITQQLVKLITQDDDQRIQRKIQEMRRAMYLESRTSKEEIMENYLNTVMLSNGCYGVQAAANMFFNKDACDLELIEAAAIASIVQSPTAMNPIRRPERNKERRDACLENMLEYELITQEEFDRAYDKELVINRPEGGTFVETVKSYYVDQIIEDVTEDLMEKYGYTRQMASRYLFSGGLQIYSCMDRYIQECMEHVYTHDEYFPKQSEGAIPYQSAMVVIDPYNGDLLGIVGGRGDKVQRGLNRASASQRQAGSSIKPISVYAPALDRGIIDWGTPLNDSPSMIVNKKWWPQNYPAGNEGMITLKRALAASKNTTAVRVLQMLTPEYSFRFMYDELNMHSLVDQMVLPNGQIKTDIDIAPLALGGLTKGLSVYELTAAYSILANKGIYSKPRSYMRVEDPDGNIVLDNRPEKKIVISEETAWIMTKLLKGVVEDGTAKGLQMKYNIEVAGKTGTTNEDYDRWFIGYTPYYLCGAWFGYDMPKFLGVDTGAGNPPMKLFNYVMDDIHKPIYDNPKTFEDCATIVEARYCRSSGMAPGPYCGTDIGYYAKGSEPSEMCRAHSYVPGNEEDGEDEESDSKPDEESTTEPVTEKPEEPKETQPQTEPETITAVPTTIIEYMPTEEVIITAEPTAEELIIAEPPTEAVIEAEPINTPPPEEQTIAQDIPEYAGDNHEIIE